MTEQRSFPGWVRSEIEGAEYAGICIYARECWRERPAGLDEMLIRRHPLPRYLKLADLLIISASFVLVTWVSAPQAGWPGLQEVLTARLKIANFLLFGGLMIAWHLSFTAFGLYRGSWRLSSGRAEAIKVFKATSVGSLVLLNVAILFDVQLINSWFVAAFWISSTAMTLGFRVLLESVKERVRLQGRNLRKVLIVGTNARARKFAAALQAKRRHGYNVIGFADRDWTGLREFQAGGEKLVATLDSVDQFLRENVVDEVVMALPMASHYGQGESIIHRCEEQGIPVHFLPGIFDSSLAKPEIDILLDEPVITHRVRAKSGLPTLGKRVLDSGWVSRFWL